MGVSGQGPWPKPHSPSRSGPAPHLQGDSMDNVQGVNDIAQRLAHFPAMGISHDGMKVDL